MDEVRDRPEGEPAARGKARPPPPLRRVVFAVITPVRRFFRTESAGGIVLVACALVALGLASSPLGAAYERWIHAPIRLSLGALAASFDVHSLVNDGLMTVFFLVAGMEIKRELATGELRSLSLATLPLVAEGGGMLAPALIYLAATPHGPARAGWAIPTATDIAFALGCLSLVKRRVPWSLFVFLTALAIFDDLGAIVIIAVFYGGEIRAGSLALAAVPAAALFAMGRAGVQRLAPYYVVGAVLWALVARSGIHPTIAGVLLGLAMPTASRRPLAEALEDLDVAVESLRQLPAAKAEGALAAIEGHVQALQPPVERALHRVHGPVAFGIVPLFALVNAGVHVGSMRGVSPVTAGVAAGLVVGKAVGVFGATFACIKLGLAPMPTRATFRQIFGVSLMAGVGFTMSIFVTGLAFRGAPELETAAKVGILGGSAVSAILGALVLVTASRGASAHAGEHDDVPIHRVNLPRFSEGYEVVPWVATAMLVGKTLGEVELRKAHGVTVLGVFREVAAPAGAGATYRKLAAIDADYRVAEGDTLMLVGERDRVRAFLALASEPTRAADDA